MENTQVVAGQTLKNNAGRWFVEEDLTHHVLYIGSGGFQKSYSDCVLWSMWVRDAPDHEPSCDGSDLHHGRHDCRYSGEPEAGCFSVCENCA